MQNRSVRRDKVPDSGIIRVITPEEKRSGLRRFVDRLFQDPPERRLEKEIARAKSTTSDGVRAWGKALRIVLSEEGYGPDLERVVRSMGRGPDTDNMFMAALGLFSNEDGIAGRAAGRMAEQLLPKVSEARIINLLAGDAPSLALEDASRVDRGEEVARLLSKMCRKVRHSAEGLVEQTIRNLDFIKDSDAPESTKRAAGLFVASTRLQVIEAA